MEEIETNNVSMNSDFHDMAHENNLSIFIHDGNVTIET